MYDLFDSLKLSLHGDLRLLGPARTPQDQGEEREEHEEPCDERREVAPPGDEPSISTVPVEEALLLDRIELSFPRHSAAGPLAAVLVVLEGAGEAGGGGTVGVGAQRGIRVGAGRRPCRAEGGRGGVVG